MSDQPRNLDSLFEAALEIESPAERTAFLDESCKNDAELRARIDRLLVSHQQAASFLETPAPGLEETTAPDASGNHLAASMDAELTAAFSLDDAVVVGDKNHSVLKMLGNTMAEVPRVSLRDPAVEGEDPISRPGSPEMPKQESDQRYQLQGEIARGGMGAVLKGRDTDLGRDLAIKVLLDSHKDNPQVIQRFIEEAQIGGQLQHPGIAPVYELGQFADQRPFFSMKLVKGDTLAKLLADRKDSKSERGKFIGIFEQICQTMAYAHSRGVIHRDLKPANIMVGAFGEVQVMDWGLAKVLQTGGVADEKKAKQSQQGQSIIQTMRTTGSDVPGSFGSTGSETQMGSVMGTPAYMPPEQALGEIDQMDQRADVFGLGAILCEILTGRPPYVGENGTQVYRMASRGKLEDAHARLDSSGSDEDLIALAKHCLEREPGDRPRDAGVLSERVTGYLESVELKLRATELQRAAEAARVVEERKRRKVTMMLAVCIIAMLTVGGASWIGFKQQQANRLNFATAKIKEALGDARVHQQLAQGADTSRAGGFISQLRELELAVQSAKLAVDRTAEAATNETLATQANTMLTDLETQIANVRQLSARDKADRAFQETLDTIRLNASSGFSDTATSLEVLSGSEDQVELASTGIRGGAFNYGPALRQYEEAFRNAGLDLDTMDNAAAAEWVRQSRIRESVILGLDHWASLLPDTTRDDQHTDADLAELSRDRLSTICDATDSDPWRKRIRAAITSGQPETLVALANEDAVLQQSPTQIVWLADALEGHDLSDKSEQLLRYAQRRNPSDFWLNIKLAWTLRNSKTPIEALGFARAGLAVRPDSPGAMIRVADTLRGIDRLAEAESYYRLALERDPGNYAGHNNLSVCLIALGKLDEAIAACQTAIEIDPKIVFAHNNLGHALEKKRQLAKAIDAYHTAISIDPESRRAYIGLGNALFLNGQLDESIDAYNIAIDIDPKCAAAYANLGNTLRTHGKLDQAVAACRSAIQFDPKFADAYNTLGVTLKEQGKLDEAIVAYRMAVEIDPKTAYYFGNLGSALRRKGQLDESIEAYQTAIDIDPENAIAYSGLGVTLAAQNKSEEGVEAFRKAIEIDPNMAAAHFNLGFTLMNQNKLKEASVSFRQVLELNPNHAKAHNLLGDTLRKLGKPEQAVAEYRKAVENDPHQWNYNDLGVALREIGRFHEAAAAHKKATKLDPELPSSFFYLGNSLFEDNDIADAIEAWARCLELEEVAFKKDRKKSLNHNNFAWKLVILSEDQQKPEFIKTALDWSKRICELKPNDKVHLNTLGTALYRAQQWQEAIAALQESIQLGSDDPYNWLFIAMSHWQLDQKDQAKEWYDKSLAWQAANAEAAKANAEVKSFFAEAAALMPELLEALLDDPRTITGLAQRAAEYVANEQFELARDDWFSLVQLQPQLLQSAFNTFRNAEQWSIAADFGQQLVDQKPEDSIRWLQIAPVVAFSGDDQRYFKFCQSILKTPLTSYAPADRAIKACLLRPNIIDTADLPSETLAAALDDGTTPAWFPSWGWSTRALLAYRSGDAESAVEYVAKSEANQPVDFIQAMNQATLAMAHHRLEYPEEAKAALEKASEWIAKLSDDPSKQGTHDLLIAKILFREAVASSKK